MLGRDDLDRAVEDGILSREQADALWTRGAGKARATGTFAPAPPPALAGSRATAALVGALAVAGGAAWLLVVAGELLGGPGSLAVALACGIAAAVAARALERRALAASGVLAAVAVVMAPAAVSGLARWLGFFPEGEPPQTLSALAVSPAFVCATTAIVAALLALRAFGAPVLSAVLVGAGWFAVMLAAPLVFGPSPTWSQRALLSSLLGAVVLGAGVALDGHTRRDHACWLYLSGLVAFSGGLITFHAESLLSVLFAGGVNVALVGAAVALRRRVFAVFGAIGLADVLGHLAEATLANALLPFAVGAIGLGLAAAAVGYARLAPSLENALPALLPQPLRRLLPRAPRR